MRRHVLVLVCLLSGCKGMGGFASGLGHVASGFGHVASAMGRVAGHAAIGLAHAAPHIAAAAAPVARGIGQVAPVIAHGLLNTGTVVVRVGEPVLEAMASGPIEIDNSDYDDFISDGPLVDPCRSCSDDCASCTGSNGYQCEPDQDAGCMSPTPPDAP